MKKIYLPLLILLLAGCSAPRPWYHQRVQNWAADSPPATQAYYSLFLIGDAGKPVKDQQEPAFRLLQKQLREAGKASGVVWLGDNLYPVGLPDIDDPTRKESERRLTEQIDACAKEAGTLVMLPGNHDWAQGAAHGYQNVRRAERFIEKYGQRGNIWLPDRGCPGPEVLELAEDIVLIVIDTQWWLHRWEKPGHELDCEVKYTADFIEMLHDAIERNKHKKVIVTAHHPLYSYGAHGGYFPIETHLFPGLMAKHNAYIPLPGLGTAAVLYRKVWGNIQDIPHPIYQEMKTALTGIFEQYPDLVYACGHDHSLQYLPIGEQHYIVSGAGSKTRYTGHGKRADFTYADKGFSRLDYYENGDVWMSFWMPEGNGDTGKLIFRKKLFSKPASEVPTPVMGPHPSYRDSTVTQIGDDRYEKGGLHRMMLGENYRQEWVTPVKAPVLDIWAEGLEIVKRGGGHQTKSLRLQDKAGRHFVLRSIRKFPEKATPELLQGTFAGEVVRDQISASHPYAAFVIPPLAEAAGVMHTNPKLVFLPDDPRLGLYQEEFGGALYLLEERPAGNRSDVASFGRSETLISTLDLVEKMKEKNRHVVDRKACLRARLFDIWLGDWDRHDDQWRWAAFEEGKETVYRPVPRDRDVPFFRPEGPIAWLALRKWALRDVQEFDAEIRDVAGYGLAARHWDRYFLSEMSENDWMQMARDLQDRLTDAVIAEALGQWPEDIYQISGPQIEKALRARRDRLMEYAQTYHRFLSQRVNVLGSDQDEIVEVNRKAEGDTRVRIWDAKKNGKKGRKLFDRTFLKAETKVIRIWAMGGDDRIKVKGEAKKGIKLRIIGGKGEDELKDQSKVAGMARKTLYYDRSDKLNQVKGGSELRDLRSTSEEVNAYDRRAFRYNYVGPLANVDFNIDDGIFVGAGVMFRKHTFRKEPYSLREKLIGKYAAATNAFSISFHGHYPQAVWGWDFVAEADIRAPNYVTNFYGLGNETTIVNRSDIGYHRVRFRQFRLNPNLRKSYLHNQFGIQLGLIAEQITVERTPDRFISDVVGPGLDSLNAFADHWFAGGLFQLELDTRDSEIHPTRGLYWRATATAHKGLSTFANDYAQLSSELALYAKFRIPLKTVLALRVGGGHNIGNFQFFQAQTLGGTTNLRGYRKNRFSGRSVFYQNTELRIQLAEFTSVLFPAKFGLVGINDIGKVWVDEENSTLLHWGYGGGIWLTPFNAVAITGTYTRSRDGGVPYVTFGWLF